MIEVLNKIKNRIDSCQIQIYFYWARCNCGGKALFEEWLETPRRSHGLGGTRSPGVTTVWTAGGHGGAVSSWRWSAAATICRLVLPTPPEGTSDGTSEETHSVSRRSPATLGAGLDRARVDGTLSPTRISKSRQHNWRDLMPGQRSARAAGTVQTRNWRNRRGY